MDLPERKQKDVIWRIYERFFEIAAGERPNDETWTGAEIRACCRLAKLFDVPLTEAAKQVVPVALTSKEKIASLHEWAHNRCLSADYAGVYRTTGDPRQPAPTDRPRRKVSRNSK